MAEKKPKSPVQSGWRGNLNGAVEKTSTAWVTTSEVTLRLDAKTAYALCNQLADDAIRRACACEGEQFAALSNLGAAVGRLIDHPSANNGGREILK